MVGFISMAKQNECEWDSYICSNAALNGQQKILFLDRIYLLPIERKYNIFSLPRQQRLFVDNYR